MRESNSTTTDSRDLIPVSITLFNLFPPNEIAPTTRLFRPEHTSRLLVNVRLDIYRYEKVTNDAGACVRKEITLFSAQLDQPSVHPSWYDLEDRLPWLNLESLEQPPKIRIVITSEQKDTVLIDDMTLHPNYLRQLPEHHDDQQISWGQPRPPPKALPINAVLIQYSDSSTRVHPSLYHLLLQRNIIEETNANLNSNANSNPLAHATDLTLLAHRRVLHFQDKAVTNLDKRAKNPSRLTPSSLLETDDETLAIPITSLMDDNETDNDNTVSLPTELEHNLRALRNQNDAMIELIKQEQALLEYETKLLTEEMVEIRVLVGDIQTVEKETQDIQQYTSSVLGEQCLFDTAIEGQQIKLLKQLRAIYPIQCLPEQHYFIRGIELPSDLHVGLVTEDEISAALGYICHSLVMLSKYLSIPLRYRIVCNSSRSAIQEDGATILPLFQSRVVERHFLDRGMVLLDRNVETLAKSRNVKCGATAHILAKMKRLYDKVVDGR